MSAERDKLLGELRQGAGGIDPVLDQAAGYVGAIQETRALAKQQGQVMSMALQNNELLYHTNKQLTQQLRDAGNALQREQVRAMRLETELAALRGYAAKLEAAGGDRYKALYEHTRDVLVQSLHDQLSPEQLTAKLADMKKQADEIAKDPTMLTQEQIDKLKEET